MVWIGAILCAFLLLCGGLLHTTSKLHAQTRQVFFDSQSLRTSHRFELALLAASRDDSLWRLTHKPAYQQARRQEFQEADQLLAELKQEADSATETALAATIEQEYQAFRTLSLTSASRVLPETQPIQQSLLDAIHRHRIHNAQQMDATIHASHQLDRWVDIWSTAVMLVASIVLILGGLELWSRIFKPTLQLSRAATEFGGGNLHARAPVLCNDEMGALAQTFNTMAEAICNREKERLEFVATVAHDLKNPLVIIGGGAYLLKRKDLAPTERDEWLDNITQYVGHMEAMISDLTDAVQAETGQLDLHYEDLDFTALVGKVVQGQSIAAPTHLLRFTGEQACILRGDRKRLERVVMNLISNAVKYSPAGRKVIICVEARHTQAVLTVEDEGVGIAPEDLPRLFMPFARLDRTRKMAKGTGLGLSSVKKIIEAHGGSIHISSQLEVGTTVEVHLPLSSTPDLRRQATQNGHLSAPPSLTASLRS